MTPRQKTNLKRAIGISWVFFVAGCGSLESGSSAGQAGTTSTSSGQTDPVTVSNTVSEAKDLQVGDTYQVAFPGETSAKIDLAGVDSGAEYVLAVANLNTSGSAVSVQLASDESAALAKSLARNGDSESREDLAHDNDAEAFSDIAARFHEELRFHESALAAESAEFGGLHTGKAMASASTSRSVPKVGDTAEFQVLSRLSGGGTVTVTATAICVADNVIFYLDQEVQRRNPRDLSSDDVRQLCSDFDARVPQMRHLFGDESDVDGNGHLNVLMTAQVNRMGAAMGGLITGFFYASNLYDPGMEIIHTLVPDSQAVYGQTVPKDFAMKNLLPSVLVHEFQHAINYNQHVLLRGGQPEDPIFNEGLSHLSEDLLGVGIENYSRYATFLARPSSYGLFSGGSPNLGARGASYLFLRYLLEQIGTNDFVSRMLGSELRGVENLETAFASRDSGFDQFGEFYLRWISTLALAGEGLSTDPRYSYAARSRHTETGEWTGVCLNCTADDGRSTVLNGVTMGSYQGYTATTVQPGGVQFYRVDSPPSEIVVYGRGAGNFAAVLVRVK